MPSRLATPRPTRRSATGPGSCAPTPATPRPPSPTRCSGATWPRARPGCRSPSTCRPRPATTRTHELARGEVGRVGVPVAHLGDMRALFDGIPLAAANTSMTINATAMWLLALYVTVARGAGRRPSAKLAGTTQNDIVKEYLSRGTYIFPPGPSLRLTTDMVAWTVDQLSEVEPDQHLLVPPAGGRRDAGAGGRRSRWPPRSRCSTRCATRGQVPPERIGDVVAADLVLRQRRACGSSRRCARCARSAGCGTSSTRERYGVDRPAAAPLPLRRAGQLARPDRGAAGEQRAAHRAGDARRDAVPGRPGPGGAAAGLERGARPAPAVGPAVVAAHAAGAGVRVRPARVPDLFDGSHVVEALVDVHRGRCAGRAGPGAGAGRRGRRGRVAAT